MSDDEWITMGPWARLVGHPCKQGTPQNWRLTRKILYINYLSDQNYAEIPL
jgi:hypothetical protein